MTDAEIIKALECHNTCNLSSCRECPLYDTGKCSVELCGYALDLIRRQKAEIERRKNNLFCKVVIDEEAMRNIVKEKVAEFELDIASIKAEAIKEFIEKTQEFLSTKCRGVVEDNPNLDEILYGYRVEDVDEFFDNLVKELVGENNGD